MAKTRLQHYATAAAINLERVADWFAEIGREKTRRSVFVRVMEPGGRLIVGVGSTGLGIRQQYPFCRRDTLTSNINIIAHFTGPVLPVPCVPVVISLSNLRKIPLPLSYSCW
jgi:hypothetical protein